MQKRDIFGIFCLTAALLTAGCSGGSSSNGSAASAPGATSTPSTVRSTIVMVGGKACPWLAGQPVGATGIPLRGVTAGLMSDDVPDELPASVTGIPITPGQSLTFSATGTVTYDSTFASPYITADGDSTLIFGTGKDYNAPDTQPLLSFDSLSGVNAPAGALLGVFLADGAPTPTAASTFTDFTSTPSRDFTSIAPVLQQVFYIGDGMTSAGTAQLFKVPTGATHLYLGTMDGFGWSNNAGSFSVTVSSGS